MLTDLDADIRKAASTVAYQWPGVVREDDIVQDLYTHLLERPSSIDKLRRMDERARYNSIVWMAHQIANRERKDYSRFKGTWRYSHPEVRSLLKAGALRWLEIDPPVQRPTDEEYLFGNRVYQSRPPTPSAVTDLRAGMARLAKRHRPYAEAVTRRFLYEEYPDTQKGRDALRNGLAALVEEMNATNQTQYARRSDGIGTRKPVRAVAAQRISKSDWDDDSDLHPQLEWN